MTKTASASAGSARTKAAAFRWRLISVMMYSAVVFVTADELLAVVFPAFVILGGLATIDPAKRTDKPRRKLVEQLVGAVAEQLPLGCIAEGIARALRTSSSNRNRHHVIHQKS